MCKSFKVVESTFPNVQAGEFLQKLSTMWQRYNIQSKKSFLRNTVYGADPGFLTVS